MSFPRVYYSKWLYLCALVNKTAGAVLSFRMASPVKIERYIPDFLTICNLIAGFAGLLSCYYGDMPGAGWLLLAAALFDLLDGAAARLLKAYSPIGAQLDSLADVVSFGVLPATIMHMLLVQTASPLVFSLYAGAVPVLPLLFPALLLAGAALRLARFNTEPSAPFFRGLPTPAMGIVVAALPLMVAYDPFIFYMNVEVMMNIVLNEYLLMAVCILLAWWMVSRVPMLSLKAMGRPQIILLSISAVLLATLFFAAIPAIILLYYILSRLMPPRLPA